MPNEEITADSVELNVNYLHQPEYRYGVGFQ